jgi:hypothetical protein
MLAFLFSAVLLFGDPPETWRRLNTIYSNSFDSYWRSSKIQLNDLAKFDPSSQKADSTAPSGVFTGWLAVGEAGKIVSVATGSSFDGFSSQLNNIPTQANLHSIRFAREHWLVTGSQGTILNSLNGKHWEAISLDHLTHFVDQAHSETLSLVVGWRPVAPENGTQIVGMISTSKNLNQWSTQTFPDFKILSVAHGESHWMVSGHTVHPSNLSTPALIYSEDGITWHSAPPNESWFHEQSIFRHIHHDHDTWVGVIETENNTGSLHSKVIRSKNGFDWEETFAAEGTISKPR